MSRSGSRTSSRSPLEPGLDVVVPFLLAARSAGSAAVPTAVPLVAPATTAAVPFGGVALITAATTCGLLRVTSASNATAYVPVAAPAPAVAEIPSHNQQTNSQRTIFFPSAPGIGPSHRGDVVTHDSEASLNCLHC